MQTKTDKVITTVVMRPLDDPTRCAQSHLWSPICDPLVKGTWGSGMGSLSNPPMYSSIGSLFTHIVYLLPLLSYLTGSKSVSVRPSVRPRHDDKYLFRINRFVERQKANPSTSRLLLKYLTNRSQHMVGALGGGTESMNSGSR